MIPVRGLDTPHLFLKPVGLEDEAYLFLLYDRAARSRFAEFPVLTTEQFQRYMVAHLDGPTAGWVIRHRATDIPMGTIYLEDVTPGLMANLHTNLDVAAVKDVQPMNGDGKWLRVMDEAAHAVIRYAFTELTLQRVGMALTTTNVPAIKLAERLGLLREGCLRRSARVHDTVQDVVIFSVVKEV